MENGFQQVENASPAAVEATRVAPSPPTTQDDDLIESDLLVEEVSIDGMCGVY